MVVVDGESEECQDPTYTSLGRERGDACMWKAWTTSRMRKPSRKTSIMIVGRRLQTRMRLCDPLDSPPTRVLSPPFPVASAREAHPRED